jgi:hypothetical protein
MHRWLESWHDSVLDGAVLCENGHQQAGKFYPLSLKGERRSPAGQAQIGAEPHLRNFPATIPEAAVVPESGELPGHGSWRRAFRAIVLVTLWFSFFKKNVSRLSASRYRRQR